MHCWLYQFTVKCRLIGAKLFYISPGNAHSFIFVGGKYHVLSTSQKAGLTGLYKKFLLLSTTAISKPVFQEVDGTVILPLTFRYTTSAFGPLSPLLAYFLKF